MQQMRLAAGSRRLAAGSILLATAVCWQQLDNTGGMSRPGALRAHFQFKADGKRIAYCRIRKNGCSTIQRFIVKTSPFNIDGREDGFAFLRQRHRVRSLGALRAADHRILVYRDPVERIRSVYVNKFLQRQGSTDLLGSYHLVTGKDPDEASFEDFILDYVSKLKDVPVDPHVWPQYWHLCNVIYDRAFPLDNLYEAMLQMIGEDMAARFFQTKVNSSADVALDIGKEIRARISEIYSEDFQMIRRII